MSIRYPSETWYVLIKFAAETKDVAYDRAKNDFESIEVTANVTVVEYFARVNAVLTKLPKHKVITPARKVNQRVLRNLIARFRDEVRLHTMKGDFDLKYFEAGLARVWTFQ